MDFSTRVLYTEEYYYSLRVADKYLGRFHKNLLYFYDFDLITWKMYTMYDLIIDPAILPIYFINTNVMKLLQNQGL